MIFAITVHGHPNNCQAARSALAFARAAVDRGHAINRVFFYHDAVHVADVSADSTASRSLLEDWAEYGRDCGTELAVCVSAAQQRGLVSEPDPAQAPAAKLHSDFEVAGLGQLVDAMITSDRLVTFTD